LPVYWIKLTNELSLRDFFISRKYIIRQCKNLTETLSTLRTLPTKGFNLAEVAARQEAGEERRERGEERRRERQDRTDQSNMSLDSSLTLMDDMSVNSSILNRSSLLEALRSEKESRPESYWRV
jgi:hypothetical protein